MEVTNMPLTPKNRKEEWLEGLVQHETTLTPKNRPEAWMKEIIDASGGGGGGGTGVLVVTMNPQTGALDKTWAEVNASNFSVLVLVEEEEGYYGKTIIPLFTTESEEGVYGVRGCVFAVTENEVVLGPYNFETDSENGYPVLQQG
jgi:hypothetical protein